MNILQKLLLPAIQLQSIIDYLPPSERDILLQSLAEFDSEKIGSTIDNIIASTTDIQLKLKLRAFNIALDNSYWHLRELHQYSSHNVIELMLDTESNIIDIVTSELKRNNIVVPEHVLVGIRNKVLEGVKEAFTPNEDSAVFEGLSKSQIKRQQDKLRKLNKSTKK